MDDRAAQEEVCRVLHARGHFEARDSCGSDWIPIEQFRSIYGLFTLGSYDLPGRHRAYLSGSIVGFCHSFYIYPWQYVFYI